MVRLFLQLLKLKKETCGSWETATTSCVPISLLAWPGGGKELAFWANYLGRIVQVAQVQCLATHEPVAAVRAIAEEFREALGVRNPYA